MKNFFVICVIGLALGGCRVVGLCMDQAECAAEEKIINEREEASKKTKEKTEIKPAALTGKCADSELVGTWTLASHEAVKLTFKEDCRFRYDACDVHGTYSTPDGPNGIVELRMTRVEGFNTLGLPCADKDDIKSLESVESCVYEVSAPAVEEKEIRWRLKKIECLGGNFVSQDFVEELR